MASISKKPPKAIFKTARPYTDVNWPSLTKNHRENILDLLCNLLQPLGDHRRAHIQPSKGKKRKRASAKDDDHHQIIPPPPPEIGNHILVGLNSVTRHLEALVAQTAPAHGTSTLHDSEEKGDTSWESPCHHGPKSQTSLQNPRPLSLVLIPHNHPPASLPHAHIPTLVHLSNLHSPPVEATRLLAVPPNHEPDLAKTLHIPHVGALGILEGAPGAEALVTYVRAHVEVTRCEWIDEAMEPEWKGVRIEAQKA